MQLLIRIRRHDLGMDIPFYIGSFRREKSIDIVRPEDSMCSMVMIEFILSLNPICFLIALSNNRTDFPCQ